MSEAWYIPEVVDDRSAENRLSPNQSCSYEALASLGVYVRHYKPEEFSDSEPDFICPLLDKIHYTSFDIIVNTPSVLGEETYASLAQQHYAEHLHEDDEVRMMLDGDGYFDVRDAQDRWVRILLTPGDFIRLPAGIYHRFASRPARYAKTLRLFRENPKWEALNRGPDADATPARAKHLAQIHATPVTAVGPAEGAKNGVYSLRYPLELDAELTQIVRAHLSQHDRAKTAIVLLLTGSVDPFTGESWCPYCNVVKPNVIQGFKELQQRLGSGALFVEAPVQRHPYLGNPAFPYRTHPTIQVKGVPTVLVLAPVAGAAELVTDEKDAGAQWYDLLEVKVRENQITPEQMSVWL